MFPGVNPKDMQKMMKKMGMQQDEIAAKEVIIRTAKGDIIIKNPQVSKVNMMGQTTYQVVGEETEAKAETNQDDIEMVMEQAGVTEDFAKAALEDAKGDVAEAIMMLKDDKSA